MKFNMLRFIAVSFLMLQPVFLQCPEETINQDLVNDYKNSEKANLRKQHASWWHQWELFGGNKAEYKAANEAQKQLDDTRVDEFKNDDETRYNFLLQKEGLFSKKSRDKKLAERAQKEIDLVNKKKAQDITKDEFKYISTERLYRFNIDELVSLAKLFTSEKLPDDLSKAIDQKFIDNPAKFSDAGIKYLKLTSNVVSKLDKDQASFIVPEQIGEILNDSGLLRDKQNILTLLLKMPVSEDVRNQIDTVRSQIEKQITLEQNSAEKLKQFENEKKEVQKLILTPDIIDELVKSKKIQLITKYQVVKFLKESVDAVNPHLLLTLREIFDDRSEPVPEKLQKALDASYLQNQEPFKNYLQYISKDAQAEVKRREKKASFEAKKAARSQKKQEQTAKEETTKQSKSTFKNQNTDFQAEDRARQAREEQERIKKEQEAEAARRRAQAEAEAKQKADAQNRTKLNPLFRDVSQNDISFINEVLKILKNDQVSSSIKTKIKSIENMSDIKNQEDWKNFYKAASLVLHPDKTINLSGEMKTEILSLFNTYKDVSVPAAIDVNKNVAETLFKKLGSINDKIA